MTVDPRSAAASPPSLTGVIVIRLWIDHGTEELRARMTWSADTLQAGDVVTTESDIEHICEHVRRWIEEFTSPTPGNQSQVPGGSPNTPDTPQLP